jgi:hypothetical protein
VDVSTLHLAANSSFSITYVHLPECSLPYQSTPLTNIPHFVDI